MNITKIAIPSNSPGGLMSERSKHFGHCDLFTLIDITDGKITGVQVVDNIAHGAGGCSRPIELLQENKVNSIVVSGMGAKPLQKFSAAGINVFYAPKSYSDDVYSVVNGVVKNAFSVMDKKQTCKGQGKCHQQGRSGKNQMN